MVLLSNDNSNNNGHGLWKFNSSLVYDEVFVEDTIKLIAKTNASNEFIGDAQNKMGIFKIWNSKIYDLLLKSSCWNKKITEDQVRTRIKKSW